MKRKEIPRWQGKTLRGEKRPGRENWCSYWAKRTADHLQANGYDVAREVPVGGGRTIDIVATSDGKEIAFEIETGRSDAIANIKKCLDAGFDKVLLVTTSVRADRKIRTGLEDVPKAHVIRASKVLAEEW